MEFRFIAIAILAVFYSCYFAKMISQKKRGIQTDQIGKGKKGTEKLIENAMRIASYLVVAVEVAGIILGINSAPLPIRIIGAAVGIAGTGVFIAAVLTMCDSWRAGVSKTDKTELITDGIYRISRNPAFLGFDLLYVGILMMFFNWALLAASVFAAFMYHLQIFFVEEKFLLEEFGDEYLQYKRKVCRYIGRK